MIRWRLDVSTRFGFDVGVDIEDLDYSGGVQTICGGANPLVVTLGQQKQDVFKKVNSSEIRIQARGQFGDFEDLFERDLSRFRIFLYVNGQLESQFVPLPDTFSEPATCGEHNITIRGAGLGIMKQRSATSILTNDVYRRIDAVRILINDFFHQMNVVDGSQFWPSIGGGGLAPMSLQYIKPERLEGMNAYQALESLIGKGFQARVARGRLIIVPVTEPTFTGYEFAYNGSLLGTTTYNQNFTGLFVGDQYSVSRSKIETFDGIHGRYQPGETGNIVPSGDLNFDDFQGGTNGEIPIDWSKDNAWSPINVNTRRVSAGSDYAWRIFFADSDDTDLNNPDPAWVTQTEFQMQQGERIRVGATVRYNNVELDANTANNFLLEVKLGDYYLVQSFFYGSSGPFQFDEVQWVHESDIDSQYTGINPNDPRRTFLRLGVQQGGFQDFQIPSPQIPQTGSIQYRVSIDTLDGRTRTANSMDIQQLSTDAADEDGQIIREIETFTANEDGELYEYTEVYGDGPVVISPGAISVNSAANIASTVWQYQNDGPAMPLAELEGKYLFDQLGKNADRISGRADVYDSIDLIDGKRVNYMRIDYRQGRSDVELIEIQDHNLDAVSREQKDRGESSFQGRGGITLLQQLLNRLMAIGVLLETVNSERTQIEVELDQPVRVGFDYWIINESQLSQTDRFAGIYAITPVTVIDEIEYGPGILTLPIESQSIDAPEGSIIMVAPGQSETEKNVVEERIQEGEDAIEELNEVTLPALEQDLLDLDAALAELNNVTIPALQADLDNLNNVELPQLQQDLADLNVELDAVLPITETKISDNAISTPKLQTNAVTAGKILAGSVTTNKIAAGAVVANSIAADAITANKIGADQIAAFHIQTDAITANKIQADAITSNKIGSDQIATFHLQADAVTANKIDVDDLFSIAITVRDTIDFGAAGELTFNSGLGSINFDTVSGSASILASSWEVATGPSLVLGGMATSGAINLGLTGSVFMTVPIGDTGRNGEVYRDGTGQLFVSFGN